MEGRFLVQAERRPSPMPQVSVTPWRPMRHPDVKATAGATAAAGDDDDKDDDGDDQDKLGTATVSGSGHK